MRLKRRYPKNMGNRVARAGWACLFVMWLWLPSLAGATPPSLPTLSFDLTGAAGPRRVGQDVSFPLTVRARVAKPASSIRVYLTPGVDRVTTVSLPAMSAGQVEVVTVSLPLHSVGDFPIMFVGDHGQRVAVAQVRPDRVTVVPQEDYARESQAVLRDKLNNRQHTAQNGGPLDGLRTAIVAEKLLVARGEPMSFHISISNVGTRPLTIADARLGSGEMTVLLDGQTVGVQGFGKQYPVTDPFPDGLMALNPGQRWDGKIVVDDPKDLEEIAGWKDGTFTYRFIYRSLAAPSSVASSHGLENLWQGSITAGDSAAHTVRIAGGGGPRPTGSLVVPVDAAVGAGGAALDAGGSAMDVGGDASTGASPRIGRFGCSVTRGNGSRPTLPGCAIAAMVLVSAARRRARRRKLVLRRVP